MLEIKRKPAAESLAESFRAEVADRLAAVQEQREASLRKTMVGSLPLQQFVDAGDQALIDAVAAMFCRIDERLTDRG